MNEPADPNHVPAIYERMYDEMLPFVKQNLVAIAAFHNGQFHQHATGTLVQFSGHHFVVTAAHAIQTYDDVKDSNPELRLFVDNGDSENLVPLDGRYRATKTARDRDIPPRLCVGDERDDLWDIGLWELDRHTVDALTTKRFLNRANISITEDLTTGVYFLAGCPCSWAQTDAATDSTRWRWLRYIAHPYREKEMLPNFDERFHMALGLGEDPQMPELEGISGCSIWKLSDLPLKEDWNVGQVRVVAVETCYPARRTHKAIRGTKWQFVVKVLATMHPEIWEAFKLWLPGEL